MISVGPKITLVYVFPHNGHQGFAPLSLEFALSYQRNPPGMEHDTLIVCNGAPATQPSKDLFNGVPNLTFIDHDNSGWDIGAFQLAARTVPADMMVFFAVHTYFRKPGWLLRMWETYQALGDTLYGSTGNQGDLRFNVHPHIRTTGFWCNPALINEHPYRVSQTGGGGQRYNYEHGQDCLTNYVKQTGRTPWIVGWNDIKSVDECNSIPGGFHQGDQYNVLVGDRLCKTPYGPDP